MMKACLAIPPLAEYPWDSIEKGLREIGFEVLDPRHGMAADILVTWSPWKRSIRAALQKTFDDSSRPVIVVENGWLSPLPSSGELYYQVALDGWNGTGIFPAGDGSRWASWGVQLKPWRTRIGYALICGQRGHPYDDRSMPPDWHRNLDLGPGRTVLRRNRDATRPLIADLSGASDCHVWTSNAASLAVIEGVPVVQHGPNLMVGALAKKAGDRDWPYGRREPELERLAWAQWSAKETASGQPFARLLDL